MKPYRLNSIVKLGENIYIIDKLYNRELAIRQLGDGKLYFTLQLNQFEKDLQLTEQNPNYWFAATVLSY